MPVQFEEHGPAPEEVAGVIEKTFADEGWRYTKAESGEYFIGFSRVSLVLRYVAERRCLIVVCRNVEYAPSIGQDAVPSDRLLRITRLLLDANYNILLGKFSRDDRDGEISLETAVPLAGGQLTPQIVDHAIGATVSTYKEYHPKIAALKYGSLPTEEDTPAVRF